jgi:hypothetical protein
LQEINPLRARLPDLPLEMKMVPRTTGKTSTVQEESIGLINKEF